MNETCDNQKADVVKSMKINYSLKHNKVSYIEGKFNFCGNSAISLDEKLKTMVG